MSYVTENDISMFPFSSFSTSMESTNSAYLVVGDNERE